MTITTEQEYNAALSRWERLFESIEAINDEQAAQYVQDLITLGQAINEYEFAHPNQHALLYYNGSMNTGETK